MKPSEPKYDSERIQMSNRLLLYHVISNDKLDTFDKSVVKGIVNPYTELQSGGEYYSALSEAIANPIVDKEALFSIGVDVGTDICRQTSSPKGRILKFLSAIQTADDLRLELIGEDSHYASVQGFGAFMRSVIVSELLKDTSTELVLNAIKDTLEKTIEYGDNVEQSYYGTQLSRLMLLGNRYATYNEVKNVAEKYDIGNELSDDEYASLKRGASLLTREAMRHRKYGTKPAYIDASIGGAWIFYDGDDWRQKMPGGHRADNYSNVAAVVMYSPYNEFKSLGLRIDNHNPDFLTITGPSMDKATLMLYIGQDGVISTDLEGLEDLGLDLNLSHTQELALKAEVVSNFYDLSMPVMKNRPTDKTFEDVVDRKKQKFNPIQELLIPRIRYIEQGEYFSSSDDITRSIREHDVVWFVRTLPSGWHASPEAVAEAEAHGIELAENETFVKAHTRGRGNKALGYHAVRRSNRD